MTEPDNAPSPAAPPPTASPKVDPETLVLRGRPRRVVRFRKNAIVAIGALGSATLVGVAWVALKPASLSLVASGDDRPATTAKAPPDALASAPATYDDVPQLGPPLPGDLGRPILEHQRQIGAVPTNPAGDAAARGAQEAAAERQRIAAERKAARESGVMMQLAGGQAGQPSAPAEITTLLAASQVPSAAPADISLPPDAGRPAVGRPPEFDLSGENDASSDTNPHTLQPPASPYMLSAGSVIAASLITGLNSDLPGLVTAQVTENAYDSATGRILLIPQGSRLIGSYDSVVAYGQSRALVVWQRIILPDGSSIRLENAPVTDAAGYAGLADKVDRHSWQLLKGVALSTLLGIGTELSIGGEGDLIRAIRESTQQGAARAGDQIVSKNLQIQPTITVRPGWPLRVVVHKDLLLAPWRG